MARRLRPRDSAGVDWLGAARVGTLKPFIDAFAHDAGRPTYSDVYARVGHGEPDRLRITTISCGRATNWRSAAKATANRQRSRARIATSGCGPTGLERAPANNFVARYSDVGSFREGTVTIRTSRAGSVRDRRSSEYQEVRGRAAWQLHPRHWLEGGFEWTHERADYRYAASVQYSDAVAELFARDPGSTAPPNCTRNASVATVRGASLAGDRQNRVGTRLADRKDDHRGNDRRKLVIRPAIQPALADRAGD